jgi:cytochrome bd-type quinol oxidase subunit 2
MSDQPCIHCHINGTACHCYTVTDHYQLGLAVLAAEARRDVEHTRTNRDLSAARTPQAVAA